MFKSLLLLPLSRLSVLICICSFVSTVWSQSVIYENNFDDDATGIYTIANLNADWNTPPFDNGVEESRVSIVDDSEVYSGKSLAVLYPEGQHRSANSGAQWQLLFDQGYEELFVEYRVKFRDGFDFVRGGKLPGLIGGEANTGGDRPDGTDGFSARMHWRTDGSSGSPFDDTGFANITQYLYHPDQPNTFAEDFRWDDSTAGDWAFFESDRWYHLRHRVVMNSVVNGAGQHDGIVQAWLDGQMVLDLNSIRFRDVETLQIDGFYFSTFFGGSGDQWNASKDDIAFFDDFRIFRHLLGDVDKSGTVDFMDIPPFIDLLIGGIYQAEADCNEDNVVSFTDISYFISLLIG
jgi:hypothetical protein